MVTIKIAALVGLLLLAGLCVHRMAYPPQDDITVGVPMQQPAQHQPLQHKPDIDVDQLGRAFRA
ncbi:MAG: hypothetical protein ABW069_11015 [Duganella sp.]